MQSHKQRPGVMQQVVHMGVMFETKSVSKQRWDLSEVLESLVCSSKGPGLYPVGLYFLNLPDKNHPGCSLKTVFQVLSQACCISLQKKGFEWALLTSPQVFLMNRQVWKQPGGDVEQWELLLDQFLPEFEYPHPSPWRTHWTSTECLSVGVGMLTWPSDFQTRELIRLCMTFATRSIATD